MTPKAGRELDALIAEKVTGVVPCDEWSRFNSYSESRDEPHEDHDCRSTSFWPPHYSTNIAAAWEVVEKLRVEGLRLRLVEYTDGFYAVFGAMAIDTAPWQASQVETAQLAICLAALKAVEVDT